MGYATRRWREWEYSVGTRVNGIMRERGSIRVWEWKSVCGSGNSVGTRVNLSAGVEIVWERGSILMSVMSY